DITRLQHLTTREKSPVKGTGTAAAAVGNELIESMHDPVGHIHPVEGKLPRAQRVRGDDLLDKEGFDEFEPEVRFFKTVMELHLDLDNKSLVRSYLHPRDKVFPLVHVRHLSPECHLDRNGPDLPQGKRLGIEFINGDSSVVPRAG